MAVPNFWGFQFLNKSSVTERLQELVFIVLDLARKNSKINVFEVFVAAVFLFDGYFFRFVLEKILFLGRKWSRNLKQLQPGGLFKEKLERKPIEVENCSTSKEKRLPFLSQTQKADFEHKTRQLKQTCSETNLEKVGVRKEFTLKHDV